MPSTPRSSLLLAAILAVAGVCALPVAPAAAERAAPRPQQPTQQQPAQQPQPREVPAEVFVILASEAEGTIAPELASMPALRQPPFNLFRTMELLARSTAQLRAGQPETVTLPNGRVLQLVIEETTAEGRYRVRVSINRPEQRDYLPLLEVVAPPGDPFFLAGQSFMGGTLVIGVRLGSRAGGTRPTR